MKKLRIFLAEDHALVREGLRLLIDGQTDMEVVGEAEDGRTSVERARSVTPDVAVVDMVLPDWNGAVVTERMLSEIPGIHILALTVRQDLVYVRQMMSAGANGYVSKLSKPVEFLQAIRTVAAGGIHIDSRVAHRTLGTDCLNGIPSSDAPRPILTEREIHLIKYIARGYSNKEISEFLDVTVKSVETYKTRVMEKLRFRTRVQLIQFAIHQGWLRSPDAV